MIGYRYDEVNRLEHVDDTSTGATRTTDYTYNANGSLETMTQPNSVVQAYGYDTLNRLRTLGVTRGATTIHAYEYKLRPSGHRRQVLEGAKTTTYGYDDLYRLTSETIASDPNANNGAISYGLNKVGNRESRTSSLASVASVANQTYNARDWLAGDSYNANGSTTTGALAPAQLAAGSFTDTYDFEERLILRTKADGSTINISYDADGHRIAKNIYNATGQPLSLTTWLVDTNNLTGYSQVLEERVDASGGLTMRFFTYGTSLISQAVSLNAQPAALNYYATDGHGNVRELTDAAGGITDRYDYDAFASIVFRSGNTENAYRCSGEQYDADLGLYYNRARYLNPDSGRFWSADSFEGLKGDPRSLHRYLYTHSDPVNGRDPSGHITLAEIGYAAGVGGILGGISTVVANHALGRAQTVSSIATGVAIGTLAPIAVILLPEAGVVFAGFGIYSGMDTFIKVNTNENSSISQRIAAGALLIASIAGAQAANKYVAEARLAPTGGANNGLFGGRSRDQLAGFFRKVGYEVATEVRVDVGGRTRIYDIAVRPKEGGQWTAVEVKSTVAEFNKVNGPQSQADTYVSTFGAPATGSSAGSAGITEVVGVVKILWPSEPPVGIVPMIPMAAASSGTDNP